ncbi:hypothetical protein [Lysobacter gummosus]|uniref:hypothetical protein n=1 Tax=Lysobacter gummosus TaxID=262324 RepID=UPI00363514BB
MVLSASSRSWPAPESRNKKGRPRPPFLYRDSSSCRFPIPDSRLPMHPVDLNP